MIGVQSLIIPAWGRDFGLQLFYTNARYNAHGHKLRSPTFEKAQFVTALGIDRADAQHNDQHTHQDHQQFQPISLSLSSEPVRPQY